MVSLGIEIGVKAREMLCVEFFGVCVAAEERHGLT